PHPPPTLTLFPYPTLFRSSGPSSGVSPVIVGRARYVNSPGAESPFGESTTTSAGPADPAGVVTVISVSLTTENVVPGVPSNVTPDRKSTRLNSSHVKISYA